MKRITLFIVALSIISYSTIINAKENVAVYVTGQKEDAVKKVLGSKMVSYITQSDDYTAVERTLDFINALRAEHDYATSGEVSDEQIASFGKQFGAQYVAVVDVSEVYGELFVSARLINVEKNIIVESFDTYSKINSMDGLAELANNVADGLILAPGRKIQEKADAERRAQEEKEEAVRRAQQEKEEAENRARREREEAERERELLERLREQAIENLTPAGCTISGRYIVQTSPIPVQLSGRGSSIRANVSIPYGFRMAGLGELSELLNNGMQWFNTNLIFNTQVYSYDDGYGSYDYKMSVFNNGRTDNIIVGTFFRTDSSAEMTARCYAVAIKNAPSESEIQSEIRRLRSYY